VCAAGTHKQVPGLAVVLVGARTDSATYVRNKKKACAEVGIESEAHSVSLPAEVSQEELCAAVRALCANPDVHGVIVQARAWGSACTHA
jgi:5,10-methylene-tetrahydrofolate dehydrogenase/methenyl tetrahydrofolate cyclohydrolase